MPALSSSERSCTSQVGVAWGLHGYTGDYRGTKFLRFGALNLFSPVGIGGMNEISSMFPKRADMGKPWPRADLFFLKDSLERGMSLAEIAGFLRRTADEVREKAKDLNR